MTVPNRAQNVAAERVGFAPDTDAWPHFGLDADIRPALAQAIESEASAALLTVYAAVGGAPRGVGAQMLVRADGQASGYLAGGCVEADAIRHALTCLDDGRPRRLTYGVGGPADLPLACGGKIEVLVERLAPHDPATRALARSHAERRPVVLITDGEHRSCGFVEEAQNAAADAGVVADRI